jgi:hypothetical protein
MPYQTKPGNPEILTTRQNSKASPLPAMERGLMPDVEGVRAAVRLYTRIRKVLGSNLGRGHQIS